MRLRPLIPAFKAGTWLALALMAITGCSRTATSEDAKAWLTGSAQWKLNRVTVNGKPVFNNGQPVEQFGETGFDRYMEEVSFLPDGSFQGRFKGDQRLMSFRWEALASEVVVSDTIPNAGKWHIPYRTMSGEAFEMETETNAYNPPALTRIRLSFVKP